MVTARGLGYRYPGATAWALQAISLDITPGEYVLLAGHSGSGKSTLLRALNGLVPHFYAGQLVGQLRVGDWDVSVTPTSRLVERVGIVFQNPAAQLFSSTVERELAFGPASLGLPIADIRQRVTWAAEVTGISGWLDRRPHALSGGEQQRVALAAILAMRPALLALDEPFAHLDAEGADSLRALLRDIHRAGTTIIMAEHHLGRLVADATRLLVMREGTVIADGAPARVLAGDAVTDLNLPPLVRLAREQGWPRIPLTVDEAVSITTLAAVDAGPPRLSRGDTPGIWQTHPDCHVEALRDISSERPARGDLSSRPGGSQYKPTSPGRHPVIVADDIHHTLDGEPALTGLSLSIDPGEQVAMLGRNGSGKTTFLRHLNGLLKPHHGRLLVLGQDTRRARVADLARQVGLVFQDPTKQLFQPTIRREIETGPRALKSLDPGWLDSLYERLGLRPLLARSPYRVSEGERRRVALAAALAARPQVVALDEPAIGQDGRYRAALTDLMTDLTSDGRTVVLVTHDLDLAVTADRWLALAAGRLVADGAPDTVMADDNAMAAAGLRPTEIFELMQRVLKEDYARL